MGNLAFNLPLPLLNGDGAAVDVSTLSGPLTLTCVGQLAGAIITIEISNDGGASYSPFCSFQGVGGTKVIPAAAQWLRTNVSGRGSKPYLTFEANVDVAGTDAGSTFATLAVPVGNGAGAATDTSTFDRFSTFVCTGTFPGSVVLVQISEDNTDWSTLCAFNGRGGVISRVVSARFMRAFVQGVDGGVTGVALSVGTCEIGGGGGGGSGEGYFVWTLAKTWAEIYAEMQAFDGPKICLVEYDPNGQRIMTVTGETTDLNHILFMGESIIDIQVEIAIEDGVKLTPFDYGGGNLIAQLRSKDIWWEPACTTTPLVTASETDPETWTFFDINSGGMRPGGVCVDGNFSLYLYDGAYIESGFGAGAFLIRDSFCHIYLRSNSDLGEDVIANPDVASHNFLLFIDATCTYLAGEGLHPSIGPNINVSVDCSNFAVDENGLMYRIAVDSATGNVIATSIS